jgi:2-polyprenyl-3-methyl-5-hydroxy-6-metoxy-1,4-benzoquinol methylase
MNWLQAFKVKTPKHKYAINTKMLGETTSMAWSNLGYWKNNQTSYSEACRLLADHLAQSVNLNADDALLDLGCGQGASLIHWHKEYLLKTIEAVDVQKECVDLIRRLNPKINAIHCASFINLKDIHFQNKFDVILCIDAAYHSNLNSFIDSTKSVLNSKGRLGFHYLILNEKFKKLNSLQKLKYRYLLKCADVNLDDLMYENEMRNTLASYGFNRINITNLSEKVFKGFSNYISIRNLQNKQNKLENPNERLDAFKIKMTAKLCEKLYRDGLVDYVEVIVQ